MEKKQDSIRVLVCKMHGSESLGAEKRKTRKISKGVANLSFSPNISFYYASFKNMQTKFKNKTVNMGLGGIHISTCAFSWALSNITYGVNESPR